MKKYESMTKQELIEAYSNTGIRRDAIKNLSRETLIAELKETDKARSMSDADLFAYLAANSLI